MKKEACVTRTHIGGQALIEGVMMKGKRGYAVALRMPDGHIRVTTHPLKSARDKYKFLGWPVIRGVVNFIEMLALGMKTIPPMPWAWRRKSPLNSSVGWKRSWERRLLPW